MHPKMIERFFNWINERHRIYLKRQAGEPWPWTDDVILKTYSFTNVFRELDKGTVWLRENWREPFADSPTLFFNICLYRQFNLIATAEFLGYTLPDYVHGLAAGVRVGRTSNWNPDVVAEELRERKEQGHTIFTNAHMVSGQIGKRGKTMKYPIKSDGTIFAILDPLWNNIEEFSPKSGDTLQMAYERLLEAPGFGPFITYEVITDLRHTRYLQDATDIMTWANAGPGAKRGIHRLYGHPAKHTTLLSSNYPLAMQKLLSMSPDYLGEHVPALEMRGIEHSLCEFDKYERVRLGEGRPKRKFVPPHLRK